MFTLDGKTAFVTGGGSGIGEEIARSFSAQGANVVIGDLNLEAARRVSDSLGAIAHAVQMDVTDVQSVRSAFEETRSKFGRLDVLVNNAGIGLVGNVEETAEEDFERLMRVNVRGVYLGCKEAVPLMLDQGAGNIINIGSVAALVGIERRFAYSASKGAVVALTRQLAIDYVAKGIRCNVICPGTVYTPFVDSYLKKFHADEIEETKQKLDARQPLGRMGRPDEVAKMAVYLASDDAEFVTGAVMTIDGGLTAR
jgi:NAD(P)-dependent dehydrogenase (short-subunit alcohol dehydrogenase family)